MSTPRHLLAAAVATLVVMTGCGGDEAPPAGAPRPPGAAAPAARGGAVSVNCVTEWTQGNTGTFTCKAAGPEKDRVQVTADTLHLDKICVSDERITSYTFGGGQTAPITATGTPPQRCQDLGGVKRLPESCVCTPPAGGNCTPAATGKFICVILGHVG